MGFEHGRQWTSWLLDYSFWDSGKIESPFLRIFIYLQSAEVIPGDSSWKQFPQRNFIWGFQDADNLYAHAYIRTHTYMAVPGCPRAAPGLPQAATTGCMEIVFHFYLKRAGVDANENSFCSKRGFPRFWKRLLIFSYLIPE